MISAATVPHEQELDLRPVLASVPLKPGFDRSNLSRYGDANWDLGPAVFRENARRCHVTINFESVEHTGVREALREFLYARLNVDLPGHRKRLPPGSVRQVFNRARRFFEFVRDELGDLNAHRVDQQILDRYARHLKSGRTRQPASQHSARMPVLPPGIDLLGLGLPRRRSSC